MDSPWIPHEFPMDLLGISYGFPMDPQWIPYGSAYEFHMDLLDQVSIDPYINPCMDNRIPI